MKLGKSFQIESKEESCDSLRKFVSQMVEINKAVKAGNFTAAYKIIDSLRYETQKPEYSKEDRAYIHAKLLDILVKQYGNEILMQYEAKIEQYQTQEDIGIEFARVIDKYPRPAGMSETDYKQAYYRSKAKAEINEETRKYRYGGYMHSVIDRVLNPEKYGRNEKGISGTNGKPKIKPLSPFLGINNDRDER